MIDEAKVYEGLSDIFMDVFLRDDIRLHADLSAKDVEGWDSFRNIEIIMATEQRFVMKFTSAELDNLMKLGDLVAIVAARGKSVA
jgi:acyl carrier protein